MIDLHFDLLTKLYTSYLENDYEFIDNFIKNYNKNNVTGVIANLCFMSKEEMKAEYHENHVHGDDDRSRRHHFSDPPRGRHVSHGTSHQRHLRGVSRTLLCVSLRSYHRDPPHDLHGDTAAGADGRCLRGISLRHAVPPFQGQADLGFHRGSDRHRYHRRYRLLPGHDADLGPYGTHLVFLCAVLHRGNTDRRKSCLFHAEADAEGGPCGSVPAGPRLRSLSRRQ